MNPVMHQVFMREAGDEKETWQGSPLQEKANQLQDVYRTESEPIIQRRQTVEKGGTGDHETGRFS